MENTNSNSKGLRCFIISCLYQMLYLYKKKHNKNVSPSYHINKNFITSNLNSILIICQELPYILCHRHLK